jgi:hypothetical protein
MGCNHYNVGGWDDESRGWKEGTIKFDDLGDGDLPCLCMFDSHGGTYKLDISQVRAMAYLGAAVALQHGKHEDYRVLPYGIPEWIREEIDRNILTRPTPQNDGEKP